MVLASRITQLQAALSELAANRQHFSDDTYSEIAKALNEKLFALQTAPDVPARVTDTDEIRLVTVMFVDVENSTQLAQNLDEEWKAMIGDVHSRLARVVEEWDGEVGQYLGDGMLCYFGAHRSRDDDAVRAVSCGLAIQQVADDYAPYVRERYNEDFALRIGISSGRVVVGVIGTASKSEFVAMGPTTNLAARLQQFCPPKAVLIDATTYHRVRERFITESQILFRLKGLEMAVESYVVTGRRRRRPASLTGDQIAGIPMPFVGRAMEYSHLLRLWDAAVGRDQFHVITLYGETGVGKSRLLQEALAVAAARPFFVLSLVARYERRGTSYNLLRDLLADLCSLPEGAPASIVEPRIIQCVQETWRDDDASAAAAVLGRLAGYGFPDQDMQRLHPLQTVARWLRSLAGDQALLLAVDDLHWADTASLDMLEYLATEGFKDTSGVLVGTARPDFLRQRPTYMMGSRHTTEMTLAPLNDAATRALIDSILEHVDNTPSQLAAHICERSEGNPLFVEEFLRMLFDGGVFEPNEDGRWRTNLFLYGTTASTLPNGLMGVFQARLDDLPTLARRVVQLASVIGQTFWKNAVSHLGGFDVDTILDELTVRGIIVADDESGLENQREYHFRHTLYREVAYAMLTRADRETYHRRTAEWLAGYVFDRPEYLGLLGEHLLVGNKREQALAIYLAAASDRAKRGLAVEALKLIDAGLASAKDVPREVAVPWVSQLWMWQGHALNALERYEEASAAGQSALRLMGELPSDDYHDERAQAQAVLDEARRHLGHSAP